MRCCLQMLCRCHSVRQTVLCLHGLLWNRSRSCSYPGCIDCFFCIPWFGGAYHTQGFRWSIGCLPDSCMFRTHEMFIHCFVKHGYERIVVTVCVEYYDGFAVYAKLLPCNDFHQFLQSSASSRKCNGGVRKFRHSLFSGMHVFCDYKFGHFVVMPSSGHHELRYDTYGFSTGIHYCVCAGAHQSHGACTVDQSYASGGHELAQLRRRVIVYFVYLCTRCAVNAYCLYHIVNQ